MATTWVEANDVRIVSGLTENKISDEDINALIESAQKEVISVISTRVLRERVLPVDDVRQNEINGTNKDYYIKNYRGNYLSDYNLDLAIDTDDVTVYLISSETGKAIETVIHPASIDSEKGKFTMATAPNNINYIEVSYSYCPHDILTPNPLLKTAVIYLTSAWAYSSVNLSKNVSSTKFGNTSISYGKTREGPDYFMNLYNASIMNLSDSLGNYAMWGESTIKI
jgi:hypothetical protein